MRNQLIELKRKKLLVLVGLGVAVVAAAAVLVIVNRGPPLGDCWGGVLSQDPLHCYVMEQAQSAGVIDVEGIYEAAGVLRVFLGPTDAVRDENPSRFYGEEVGVFFKEKATEFVERWPDRLSYDQPFYLGCVKELHATYEDCLLNIYTSWKQDHMLPQPRSYVNILFRTGELRSQLGWASFRQLWPAVGAAEARDSGPSGEFDVSDVDTTNFPESDCAIDKTRGSCGRSKRFPSLNIAGWVNAPRKTYYQVKAPADGEVDVGAVRDVLVKRYIYADREDYIIIPVKYSYDELWRWATILNRFSVSSGNTLGITAAYVGDTAWGGGVFDYALPSPLAAYPESEYEAWEDRRTTIWVWTLHPQQTVDALPRLLGQLGIPVDAVGVAIEDKHTLYGPMIPDVGP